MTFVNRKKVWSLTAAALLGLSGACTSGPSASSEEPVAAEPPAGADPSQKDKANPSAPKTDETETVGTLTEQPPGVSPKVEGGTTNTGETAAPPPSAFGDESTPDPAAEALQEPRSAKSIKKQKGKARDKASAKAVKAPKVRYVKGTLLNVRAKPSLKAPVVRKLLGGAEVRAEIHGGWAKIGDGEWVRTKHLSTKPTRQVSEDEAQKAEAANRSRKASGGDVKAPPGDDTPMPDSPDSPGASNVAAPTEVPAPEATTPAPEAPPSTDGSPAPNDAGELP